MIPLSDEPHPDHRFPFVTIALILANVAVFFLWQMGIGLDESVKLAAFVPSKFAQHVPGSSFGILVSMFMHGGFMHLLGNMWFLWIFGDNVESATGPVRYIVFYLLCGVLATLGHVASDPFSRTPIVGASGAISGVLGAYLVMHPGARIRTLIPLGLFTQIANVPAWIFLFIWIGMQVLSQAATRGGHGGGVAYLAHIGGFVAGAVLIFFFKRRTQRRGMPAHGMEPW